MRRRGRWPVGTGRVDSFRPRQNRLSRRRRSRQGPSAARGRHIAWRSTRRRPRRRPVADLTAARPWHATPGVRVLERLHVQRAEPEPRPRRAARAHSRGTRQVGNEGAGRRPQRAIRVGAAAAPTTILAERQKTLGGNAGPATALRQHRRRPRDVHPSMAQSAGRMAKSRPCALQKQAPAPRPVVLRPVASPASRPIGSHSRRRREHSRSRMRREHSRSRRRRREHSHQHGQRLSSQWPRRPSKGRRMPRDCAESTSL
eukprot:scaffold655_cov105-Isochrysis_galbana.AAC.11